jgi:hypothetical protein
MASEGLVHIFFLDAESGSCFAQTEMPAEDLPASFEARTTLNLQGQEWEVIAAEPVTRAEFTRTGELRLSLRKIEIRSVPADTILFSLPTICDEIPGIATGTSKLGRQVIELHEDDWRQVELVTQAQQAQIDAGLASVSRIYAQERTPAGFFRKLHVRSEVRQPLEGCRLSLAEVLRSFPDLQPLEGLAYRDVAGLIEGGYACAAPSGLRIYGVQKDGNLAVFGLLLDPIHPAIEQDARVLSALMRRHDLCLVDWCRVQQVPNSEAAMVAYFTSNPNP